MTRIDVITIFPDLFGPFLDESFVGQARAKGVLEVAVHDLRAWTTDRHRTVDDAPYGGGPGMVLKPEPLVAAIEALAGEKGRRAARVVLLSPQGRRLDQGEVARLAREPHLVLVCGRYEGVDQRAIELAIDEEVSIGDYVLSGGEVPAMVVVEAITRLLPGVLGNPESVCTESFQAGLLEGPQYTRPAVFRGREVPEVLRSGDHAAVARWRAEQAWQFTRTRRPDLASERGARTSGPEGEEER
ncbi:MAG TPA: tRNA (guanosine(37)-N1)-methyltransferase TrmD [Myxococcota bacterium]|nr:tRNA (guanosine(37)-N1)-methyltransferase TrmD [Myxococcota bacterium]